MDNFAPLRICIQPIQLRLSFQKRKLWIMYAQVMMGYCLFIGQKSQGIPFSSFYDLIAYNWK